MSEQIKDGGPAFPIPVAGCNDGGVYNTLQQSNGELGGMTLRDYFAAKAIRALASSAGYCELRGYWKAEAETAYAIADAMLSAREVKA